MFAGHEHEIDLQFFHQPQVLFPWPRILCQVFRRSCFEAVGGFPLIRGGGEDRVAVTTARMLGWRTRTFTEKTIEHHRPLGTAGTGALKSKLQTGHTDYLMGNHPLWEGFRALYQTSKPPLVVGGLAIMVGYFGAWIRRERRPISDDLIAFSRREQMQRLRRG